MNETNDANLDIPVEGEEKKARKIKPWLVVLLILLGLALMLIALYIGWLRPLLRKPLGPTLSFPHVFITTNTVTQITETATSEPTATLTPEASPTPTKPPVCGEEAVWYVLLVGIDTAGTNYNYGLADVIRIARVDFTEMTVDMIALPRDLLVNAPDGLFKEENPMKINQGYLFGTSGWSGDSDQGNGAISLAQVIYANFGIKVDHYAVVNFTAVEHFIDSIGGVYVNLPYEVYDPDPAYGYFPSGSQLLSGERAMDLMRIRTNYSDGFRIGNQSIVLKAIIKQMMDPGMILRIPALVKDYRIAFLTDLSIEQIVSLGSCFLDNFDIENMRSHQPEEDLLLADWEYIPTLSGSSYVYRWDQRFIDWANNKLHNR